MNDPILTSEYIIIAHMSRTITNRIVAITIATIQHNTFCITILCKTGDFSDRVNPCNKN